MRKTEENSSATAQKSRNQEYPFEEYIFPEEPFYLPVAHEVEIFEAAFAKRLPILLKGPTGCGKTRFLEYMSHRLGPLPLITVACHEDLTATDFVGRYLLEGEETRWLDGPLTRAVKAGAICYLDEIVEARKDTTVLIHPLSDHRRILPIERRGQIIEAHENFQLVISYNPGYQTVLKDLKPSTRQRFVAIEFDYPPAEIEAKTSSNAKAAFPKMSPVNWSGLAAKCEICANMDCRKASAPGCWSTPASLSASGLAPRARLPVRIRPGAHRRRRS